MFSLHHLEQDTFRFIYFCAQDAFLCELEQVIKKIKKIQLTRDEGWYSEAEVKELGWSASVPECILEPHILVYVVQSLSQVSHQGSPRVL